MSTLTPDYASLADAALQAAAIDHPGFARVLEVGEAHGIRYVAHEHVEAQPLPQDPPRLIRAVRDAALALQEAHARGVVHGGLGPSTILIDRAGGARILGLGLSTGSAASPASDTEALAALLRERLPDLSLEPRCASARELADALTRVLLGS